MKPAKSGTSSSTGKHMAGSSEESTENRTGLKALDSEESEDDDLEDEDETDEEDESDADECESTNVTAAPGENKVAGQNKEKPAATYIANTEEWETLRRDMEKANISYTSVKRIGSQIEIKVADSEKHLMLICFLLSKGVVHKTYVTRRLTVDLPEYVQELRRRKNKARRLCYKYPSRELKRESNYLTRVFRQELANLRYKENDKVQSLLLDFSAYLKLEKENEMKLKV